MHKYLYLFLPILSLFVSCTTHRPLQHSPAKIELAARAPETPHQEAAFSLIAPLQAQANQPSSSMEPPVYVATTTEYATNSVNQYLQVSPKVTQFNQHIATSKVKQQNNKIAKPNFAQKIVLNKMIKKMSKAQGQGQDFNSLDGNLKIGFILLGVALLLALFGLGLIGGIAAIIALAFIILGLLNTY